MDSSKLTHKDAVLAAVRTHDLTVMSTPKLPSSALEFITVRDTLFVRGSKSRDMIEITFTGDGDIECFTVPPGTLGGDLAGFTDFEQVPEGNPPFEPMTSADLLELLADIVFPEFSA